MKKDVENCVYSILITMVLIFLFSTYFYTFSTSQDPSLYVLSSLAQSQAAIFAIVIGLNSIALQHTATNYSSRVTKIFTKDSKFLWGLLGFSIFYDLILIIALPSNLERIDYIPIVLAVLFAIFAYDYMIRYIHDKITIFLDPVVFISKLDENNDVEDDENNNRNVKIFDFIIGSLNRYDYNSYKKGLSLYYKNKLNKNYITKNMDNEGFAEEFNSILSEFILVGNITSSTKNDIATSYLVDSLFDTFSHFENKDKKRQYFLNSSGQISEFIEYCARNGLEKTTILGMEQLYNIFSNIESDIVDQMNILRALAFMSTDLLQ